MKLASSTRLHLVVRSQQWAMILAAWLQNKPAHKADKDSYQPLQYGQVLAFRRANYQPRTRHMLLIGRDQS